MALSLQSSERPRLPLFLIHPLPPRSQSCFLDPFPPFSIRRRFRRAEKPRSVRTIAKFIFITHCQYIIDISNIYFQSKRRTLWEFQQIFILSTFWKCPSIYDKNISIILDVTMILSVKLYILCEIMRIFVWTERKPLLPTISIYATIRSSSYNRDECKRATEFQDASALRRCTRSRESLFLGSRRYVPS